ncbi:MAG: serine/threonine-protein kinase PpkA, partial [Acidobacteriota bacterium]|nr:serine/threonine-protein kinase PpkA [Acidobacteriota bacterium]
MSDFPQIPGYDIKKVIGRGKSSTVALAIQKALKRTVAIKILDCFLLKSLLRNESNNIKEKFLQKAAITAKLRHSNIVTIYDFGQQDNYEYIIMEYLEKTLEKYTHSFPENRLTPKSSLRIIKEIMAALDYMHTRKIIHQHIKTDKIMFRNDGTPVLVHATTDQELRDTYSALRGAMEFDPEDIYKSPEQYRRKAVDGRSDIYSLGVVLFEILTGTQLKHYLQREDFMHSHMHKPPKLPENLIRYQLLIDKMMAIDPGDRYQNTEELLKDIQKFLGNEDDRKASGKTEFITTPVSDDDTNKIYLPSESDLDDLENNLRTAVQNKNYMEGKRFLRRILTIPSNRAERLKDEFGHIYNLEHPEKDENDWKQNEAQIAWRHNVWRIMSARNSFDPVNIETIEEKHAVPGQTVEKIEFKTVEEKIRKIKKESEKIGEDLEQAVLKLFHHFLEICRQENGFTITNERQQGRGQQYGHDLKFVCLESGEKKTRYLIECKNLSRKITLDDIAGKLAAAEEYQRNVPIDHWILVSPNEDVSNELEKLLELWNEVRKYPFNVHAWTPATRVKEFFGLIPAIYDEIFNKPDLNPHPNDWNEEKKKEVIKYWKQQLEPPVRLPQGWEQYLRDPGKLVLEHK